MTQTFYDMASDPFAGIFLIALGLLLLLALHLMFFWFKKDTEKTLGYTIEQKVKEIEKLKKELKLKNRALNTFRETTLKDSMTRFTDKLLGNTKPVDQAIALLRNLTPFAVDDAHIRGALEGFYEKIRTSEALREKKIDLDWNFSVSGDVITFTITWDGLKKPVTFSAWLN